MSDRLLPLEEALAAVLAGVGAVTETETLAPEDALGRVLAQDVVAQTSLPPWDNAAMDGFAVRGEDVAAASEERPVRLALVGEVRAGIAVDAAMGPGTAIRIATGAPMPPGADTVVQLELTTPFAADGTPGPRGRETTGPVPAHVLVHERVDLGNAIRAAGTDVHAGVVVARAGTVVTSAVVSLAAGVGMGQVVVRRRPVAAILPTGDELRRPGEPLGPAGIPDANGPGLRALARDAGADVVDLGIAVDVLEDVEERLRRGVAAADVVIVSGGVSMGPYDVVKLAFERVGHVDLWKVAIQPGKPFAFGRARVPGTDRDVLLLGLPGNPVSSFVTFELFARPVLRRLAGHTVLQRPTDRAVLEEPVSKSQGRRGFQRVIAVRDEAGMPVRDAQGRVRVRLAGGQGGQGSHVISALAAADALAVIPEVYATTEPGLEVELRWLDRS